LVSVKKVDNYRKALEGLRTVLPEHSNLCLVGKAPELDALHRELGAAAPDREAFARLYPGAGSGWDRSLPDIAAICGRLRAKHVLVTPKADEDAYLWTAKTSSEHRIPLGLTMPGKEGSLLGVSEAVGSALIHFFCSQPRKARASQSIDPSAQALKETANRFGGRAIATLGATPLSVFSREVDETALPWWVRLRRMTDVGYSAINILTIAWFIVTLVGLLFFGFKIYHPRLTGAS
jgi:hypothetical protein